MRKNILLFATVILLGSCANYHVQQGNAEYDKYSYVDAINHYEKVLDKKDDPEIRAKLADAYLKNRQFAKAEEQYEIIVKNLNSKPVNKLHYAHLLMTQGRYIEADKWVSEYLEVRPDDHVAQTLKVSINSIGKLMADTSLYTLKEVELNKFTAAFGPSIYKDGIIFTGERSRELGDKKNPWTGESYLNIYYTEKNDQGKWIEPRPLKIGINGKFHEGPADYLEDGNELIFTRSNYYKKKPLKSSENENNLKLFRAKFNSDSWSDPVEFHFNSDEYSVGHATISEDQTIMFFTSDMPGGFGGTDIYYATSQNGKWSDPVNLGPTVNTVGDEMFPYIHKDGTLYFSSDAHKTLGGLDVYSTRLIGNEWTEPENLMAPLNTSKDDFGFVLNSDSTGYISSNRSGQDKIYEFRINPPTMVLNIYVSEMRTGNFLSEAVIEVADWGTGDKAVFTTDEEGYFQFHAAPELELVVSGSKPGYFADAEEISTKGMEISDTMDIYLTLEKIIVDKPIELESIYYDLNKWEIRADAKPHLDELVSILNANPDISIELSSHTDSRASDTYNMELSQKRAQSAVDYIVSKGIKKERITAKGYGESRLFNHCKNGIDCNEEEHQRNRRTEFKVIKLEQEVAGK